MTFKDIYHDGKFPICRIDYLSEAKAASAAATQEGSDATDGVAARSVAKGAYP